MQDEAQPGPNQRPAEAYQSVPAGVRLPGGGVAPPDAYGAVPAARPADDGGNNQYGDVPPAHAPAASPLSAAAQKPFQAASIVLVRFWSRPRSPQNQRNHASTI